MNPHFSARWLPLLFVAGAAVLFARSLPHRFVYDDLWTVQRNPALETVRPVARFFRDPVTVAHPFSGLAADVYRPLSTLTFAVDRRLWGADPRPCRLENILLHGVNAALVFILLANGWGLPRAAAGFGAALFLLHPAQVESVVWVTQRSNLLCLAGMLLTLLAFRAERPSPRRLVGGLAAFAAALFSKETAAVTPILLLLWPGEAPKEGARRRGFAAAILLLLAGAFLAWRRSLLGSLVLPMSRPSGGMEHLAWGAVGLLQYTEILAAPFDLTVSRRAGPPADWGTPWPWAGLAAGALLVATAAALWRRRRVAAYALLWIAVTLAPVLFAAPAVIADRYLYAPMVGAALLAALAWEATAGTDDFSRRAARGAFAGLLVLGAFLTWRRTGDWKDDETLWRAAVRAEPGNAFARLNLADALREEGDWTSALAEYEGALAAATDDRLRSAALTNLSELRNRRGEADLALALADEALKRNPGGKEAVYNRIVALALQGRWEEALRALDDAAADSTDPRWQALREKVSTRRTAERRR